MAAADSTTANMSHDVASVFELAGGCMMLIGINEKVLEWGH